MKRFLLIFVLLFFVHTINAQSFPKDFKQNDITIHINNKSKIFLNNAEISLEDLDVKLKAIKQNNGMVHFANPTKKKRAVTKVRTKILKLVSKSKVIVQFYTDNTFKTAITW